MISQPAPPFQRFRVQNFRLDCGQMLPEAMLAYAISGEPDGSPPHLTCSAFTQNQNDLAFLRQPGGALDPAAGWTIHTELLGNGRSTSPSHGSGPNFPLVSIRDNVRLQHALLEHLGVRRVKAVIGASMGGQQALQWAASYPDVVEQAISIVGSAKATLHVQLFLHALGDCIRSDSAFANGRYTRPPLAGLSRMSEMWAPWAFSPEFFSSGAYQTYPDTQAADLPSFLAKWRTRYHHKDANDILCHLQMWATHDVGRLDQIQARVTFFPCRTDAYFAVADIQREAARIPNARVVVLDSINGHAAGFGRSPSDQAWLNQQIRLALAWSK